MIRGLAKVIREVEKLPNFRYWNAQHSAGQPGVYDGHYQAHIGINDSREEYGHRLFTVKDAINEVDALQGALDAAREWLKKEEGRDASI